jgi:F-type H+-transporting ATPase subunit gamma
MPNLKEVRVRIDSVKSTQQITSAMKLVAASKLRRTQNAILTLRPYAQKLNQILQGISTVVEETSEDLVFTQEREPNKVLLIVLSSNRGLCGSFNSNIVKMTNKVIKEKYKQQYESGNLDLFCIGKKAWDYFRRRDYNIAEFKPEIFDNYSFEKTATVAEDLMRDFEDGKYDRIDIIYNQFKNAAVQILTHEQFLPVEPAEQAESDSFSIDYIFEPEQEKIIAELLPYALKVQLYKAILDSLASENGARMTAMQIATDNAEEMVKELQLSYNKARQAAITGELIEIVSGANALNE